MDLDINIEMNFERWTMIWTEMMEVTSLRRTDGDFHFLQVFFELPVGRGYNNNNSIKPGRRTSWDTKKGGQEMGPSISPISCLPSPVIAMRSA